ncbi:MAG: serine hydrolase [Leptolyngbyaceae cyanobacterium MO_188.B28]|nr:serine hydrolase [Leptolyngbyaceae cyanobacterium MO_188.B28]
MLHKRWLFIALLLSIGGWIAIPTAPAHPIQIKSAAATPLEPPVINETAKDFSIRNPSTLTAEINAYLQAHHELGWFSGSVIVAHADEIVFTQGYGMASLEHQAANSPQTRFRLGSVTKQFTAAAILQLQDRGLLDVQASVATYLPDYPNGDRISLHHLLTHTAGIPNLTSFPDYLEWMRLPTTLVELIARFKDLPLEFEPGAKFSYSNSGYILLTQVIEAVSGQSYDEYLTQHLLHPLGLENTGYENPLAVIDGLASGYQLTDDGYQRSEHINMSVPQGAGGLYSTVEDLARWNQFLFDEGGRDNTILGDEAISAMTSPFVPMVLDKRPDRFYGYGLVINPPPEHLRIGHSGGINGFVTTLIFFPDEKLTIAVLCNVEAADPDRIARDLAAILLGDPYERPTLPDAVTVDPAIYERYVGAYQVTPEFQVSISIEADQLKIQGAGQSAFTLYPASETEFFARIMDMRIVFNQTADGTVESLTLIENGQETIAPKLNN